MKESTEKSKPPIEAENSPEKQPKQSAEYPFYRIPAPPVPGKTAWSLIPWIEE